MSRALPVHAYTLPACAYAGLLVAVALGAIGALGSSDDLSRCGILLGILSLPALIVGHIQHAHRLSDGQLADAHRAGYLLALDQVARGLLDQPTAPTDGDRAGTVDDQLGNVRHLRPIRNDRERTAG
ncbi:hypothetical protein [Streptomyces montanisoli]|uniref:Uncharacterized protein n=1 Tax=Streptomyces montanisoli TaxID=2798581 RepID=A0A940RSW9_9ACTN|nr:hypothetical protein [Streptomyces montanisoli]MBP0456217.1 hypothetical protein [Streptomyces montanisoli]